MRVTQPERTAEFAALFGDPQIAMEEMRQFSESATALSFAYAHLLDEYEGQWIAFRDRGVVACAPTFDLLLERLNVLYPEGRSRILVRFMERELQGLIL